MIGSAVKRTASLAVLAAAAGLIWSNAPAWACAPPAGGGSPSSGGESHPGADSPGYDNGAAEGARQGAAAAAAGLDNSGEGGRARASPDTAPNLEGVIDAVGGAVAAEDARRCAELQAQLSAMNSPYLSINSSSHDNDPPSQRVYDAVVNATPDQLDFMIGMAGSRGGDLSAADKRTLDFARDLRASQMIGLGEDDVKKKYQQQIAAANQAAAARAAQRQQKIRDLQSQMADLGCGGKTASVTASPVSTDASQ